MKYLVENLCDNKSTSISNIVKLPLFILVKELFFWLNEYCTFYYKQKHAKQAWVYFSNDAFVHFVGSVLNLIVLSNSREKF